MRDRCYILEQQKELSGATSGQQTSIEDSSRLDRIFPSEVPREGKSAFAGKRCLSVFTLCFTSDRPETFRAACNGAISAANENISILGGGGIGRTKNTFFFQYKRRAGMAWACLHTSACWPNELPHILYYPSLSYLAPALPLHPRTIPNTRQVSSVHTPLKNTQTHTHT